MQKKSLISPWIVKLVEQIVDGDPTEESLVELRHDLHAPIIEPRAGQYQRHSLNQRLGLMSR